MYILSLIFVATSQSLREQVYKFKIKEDGNNYIATLSKPQS